MLPAAEGVIYRPVDEISVKISDYFRSHSFKQQGCFDKDGLVDGDFAIDIRGTMDDIQVSVCYFDYKPRQIVMRELLALDERISSVDTYRFLSHEHYQDQMADIELEPIFVMVDGKLTQTTIYEYICYRARHLYYPPIE